MTERKDIRQFLAFLQENQPVTLRQALDNGFNQLKHPITAKKLLSAGVIEKFDGPNPDSGEAYARVCVSMYRLGSIPYSRKKSVGSGNPDAPKIARAIALLKSKGYAVSQIAGEKS